MILVKLKPTEPPEEAVVGGVVVGVDETGSAKPVKPYAGTAAPTTPSAPSAIVPMATLRRIPLRMLFIPIDLLVRLQSGDKMIVAPVEATVCER
jgi:hypothetical protein